MAVVSREGRQPLAEAELFDGDAPVQTLHGDAADGRVLVLGGTTDDSELLASTEVFDPATNRFTTGPTMNGRRYKFSEAIAVINGGLVVAGGNQIEICHALTNRFETVPGSQGVWRSAATATALSNGSVLVVGGYDERIRAHHDAVVIRT